MILTLSQLANELGDMLLASTMSRQDVWGKVTINSRGRSKLEKEIKQTIKAYFAEYGIGCFSWTEKDESRRNSTQAAQVNT